MRRPALLLSLACAALGHGPARAQGQAAAQDASSGAPDILELDGVFQGPETVELALRCAADPGPLYVVQARPAGRVERGELLVRLVAPELERRIEDQELALHQLQLRRRQRQAQADLQDQEQGLARWRAERELAEAKHQLELLSQIDAPEQLWSSELRWRTGELQSKEAEALYRVVVRMYEADGRLETNERLDLDMRRRALDRRERSRSWVEARHRILRDQTLPMQLNQARIAVHRARHAAEVLNSRLAAQARETQLQLQDGDLKIRRQEESLSALRGARDSLCLRAPNRGLCAPTSEWPLTDADPQDGRYDPAVRVSAGQVLARVLPAAPRWVRATVPEAMRAGLEVGQAASLHPTAAPGLSLPAELASIDPVVQEGQFAIWLRALVRHERLGPGCTCQVHLRPGPKSAPEDPSNRPQP